MGQLLLTNCMPGMQLSQPIYHPETGKLLLNSGTIINNSVIKRLSSLNIVSVEIADIYSLYITPIQQMETYLTQLYLDTLKKYTSDRLEGNMSDQMIEISKNIKKLITHICLQEKTLDYCVQLNITPCIHFLEKAVVTSIFSGLVASVMNLRAQEIYDIMIGGLLHDIGCLEMPFLLEKEDLEGQQALLWKEHPTYGYYFAIQNDFSRPIAEIVQGHHEKWDGSGYPKGLAKEEIPIGCRIVGLCQLLAEYIVIKRLKPYEALEIAYGTSGVYFDKAVVDAFVNNISLYPMGALVRLSNDEVGIVTNIRKNKGPRPLVNVFFNRFGKPLSSPKLVDLGEERTLFIKEILS